MKIEVSNGEIADKLSILEIKLKNISDVDKRLNIEKEYNLLEKSFNSFFSKQDQLYIDLLTINEKLWDIEDQIRDLERKQQFDENFIETARQVYITNDQRSEIKRKINEITSSTLFEEKSYEQY